MFVKSMMMQPQFSMQFTYASTPYDWLNEQQHLGRSCGPAQAPSFVDSHGSPACPSGWVQTHSFHCVWHVMHLL